MGLFDKLKENFSEWLGKAKDEAVEKVADAAREKAEDAVDGAMDRAREKAEERREEKEKAEAEEQKAREESRVCEKDRGAPARMRKVRTRRQGRREVLFAVRRRDRRKNGLTDIGTPKFPAFCPYRCDRALFVPFPAGGGGTAAKPVCPGRTRQQRRNQKKRARRESVGHVFCYRHSDGFIRSHSRTSRLETGKAASTMQTMYRICVSESCTVVQPV